MFFKNLTKNRKKRNWSVVAGGLWDWDDDLVTSSAPSRCSVSSTVHRKSSRQRCGLYPKESRSEKFGGETDELKHFLKKTERTSAFSWLVKAFPVP